MKSTILGDCDDKYTLPILPLINFPPRCFFFCLYRKLIVPQKEPSPLLDRKIEELEAKFADMTDEELEDLGDDDGELGDHSLPLMQSSLSGDMDLMAYTPPQVELHCKLPLSNNKPLDASFYFFLHIYFVL